MEVTITKKVRAWQWTSVDDALPDGVHLCQPEVCWSAGRKYIYFTYGKLWPKHWLGVDKLAAEPDTNKGLSGWVRYEPAESAPYYREHLPFSFWSVKSEASKSGNHRAVFLDTDDAEMMLLWYNFCSAERFPNPVPGFAEFRILSGSYGRGYKPVYLDLGDYLVWEPDQEVKAMSADEFLKMQQAAE